MKCICGYEHEEEYNKEIKGYVTTVGKEEFCRVYGTFLCETSGYYREKFYVSLYACPKCNTVQLLR